MEILYILLHTYAVIGVASAIFALIVATSRPFQNYFEREHGEEDWDFLDTLLTVLFFLFLWPVVLWLIFKGSSK